MKITRTQSFFAAVLACAVALAASASAADPMLQWTTAGSGARFCLYVHHTDAQREWAYDRGSSIGRLDTGLDEAKAKGWTVVSMKDDWKTIFPSGSH